MSEEFVIEKGIPIPGKNTGKSGRGKRKERIILESLDVGDSFIFSKDISRKSYCCIGSLNNQVARTDNKKFAVRQTPEGLRVWRVK